jgi:photosystem II stability/assembly factor-like uncharacterized protein
MLRSPVLLVLVATLGQASLAAGDNADQPWQSGKLPEAVAGRTLHGVFFLDAKRGWIVGEKGLCLATRDGGATWQVVETGSGATLRFVRFKDDKTGWICGDGDPNAPKTGGHVQGRLVRSFSDGVMVPVSVQHGDRALVDGVMPLPG